MTSTTDRDLAFLTDHEVLQVCIGRFQVMLNLSGEAEIAIEGEYSLDDGASRSRRYTAPDPTGALQLTELLGKTVSSVSWEDDGSLLVLFGDTPWRLMLHKGSSGYESFQLSGSDRYVVR